MGISPDPVKKQAKFADSHNLPFTLIADDGHAVAEQYGVWKEKSFMGRKFMGVERATFVIDKSGIVRAVYPKVSISGHVEAVLEAVRSLA